MLRCEHMTKINLYLSKENARKGIEILGENEIAHFKNLNESLKNDKLLYSEEIKYIEKLRTRLNYLGKFCNKTTKEVKNSDLESVIEEVNKFYTRMSQLNLIKKETSIKLKRLKEDLKMIEEIDKFICDVSDTKKVEFNFVTGIIDRSKNILVKKILHQVFKRNLVVKTKENEKYKNCIFIVLAHGKETLDKITKIFVSMGGRVLDLEKYAESHKSCLALTSVISQIESVEEFNEQALQNEISKISNIYPTWKYFIDKEYRIFDTLNKFNFDENRNMMVGEGWIKQDDLYRLQKLSENPDCSFIFVEVDKEGDVPPSSIKLNKYTQSFQDLVNVYGVPKYGEINPAIFMLFLFPMLFGVMFGDVFHGALLIFMSCYFIRHTEYLYENFKVLEMLIDGRYVIFLCGLASVFFGFLYSDFSSFPINIFGSRIATRTSVNDIYPFGVDPGWHGSINEMEFGNSVKMKLSIVLGFFHMGLGIVISIYNCLHLDNMVDLFSMIIPQALAYVSFLGYLVFLIVYKWLYIDLTKSNPSLISTLVTMFTSPFTIEIQLFKGQLYVQLVLLVLILICFPWMFLLKPLYLTRHKKFTGDELLDLWMNQGIHMVEYGIGLISNSSSYLRLWAVSLAHAQLTKVLVNCTIGNSMVFVQILTIPIYAAGTIFLLLGLEGLGSCLHALRLNWVEFNSKFYAGSGYAFTPLTFKQEEEDD